RSARFDARHGRHRRGGAEGLRSSSRARAIERRCRSPQMNVGAAEIDITPDFPVDLSGFASRTQPSVGVLEPIFARAMYLDDGGEKLLWIACDVVALERTFIDDFRAWAGRELQLKPHQVLLSATHTHSAPATIHLNACGGD